MPDPTPTVGRIVHYVSHGSPVLPAGSQRYLPQTRAAIVTAVPIHPEGDDRTGNMISLCILNPTGMFFDLAVPYSEDARIGGTWHWPERA